MVRRCSWCYSRMEKIGDGKYKCTEPSCGEIEIDHRIVIKKKRQPTRSPKELFKWHYETDNIFKELVDRCHRINKEMKLKGSIQIIPFKSVLSFRYKIGFHREYMFLSVDYPKHSLSVSEYRLKMRLQKFPYTRKNLRYTNKVIQKKYKLILDLLDKIEGVKIKEEGWGGYPEFTIRKAEDLERAIKLAKISILNQEAEGDSEVFEEEFKDFLLEARKRIRKGK